MSGAREREPQPAAAQAGDLRTRPVGRELEHGRGARQLARPVGEIVGERFLGQLGALPLGEVRVLERGIGERRADSRCVGVVQDAELTVEHDLGPLVEDDVMDDEVEDVLRSH